MENVLAIVMVVALDRWSQYIPGGKYLASFRGTSWFNAYLNKMMNVVSNIGLAQSYLTALILFAPLCLSLLMIQAIAAIFFGKLIKFLFLAVVLLYLLGNADANKNSSVFVAWHESSFAILFWFALLGPVGALLYWFLVLSEHSGIISEQNNPELAKAFDKVHAVVAWIPARITGFIYALVGNFSSGFSCWTARMHVPAMPSRTFIDECGRASIDNAIADDGQNLVARAFIAWSILSILIVVVK